MVKGAATAPSEQHRGKPVAVGCGPGETVFAGDLPVEIERPGGVVRLKVLQVQAPVLAAELQVVAAGDPRNAGDHTFGGINLEDISSPRCFEIEQRLIEELDIPVFHDDQHGTAIVVLAALINACRLTSRNLEGLSVSMVGAGAAGVAVAKILMEGGITDIVACDRFGAIHADRQDYEAGSMNAPKVWLAENTNAGKRSGSPADVLEGTDLFIGLSGPGIISARDLERMNPEPFVFAMANPNPEVRPEEAQPYVKVMATGRSDYPNQINNVLAFPGIFRGALDVRAPAITEEMKLAAAKGIAATVAADELDEDIIPSVFNRDVSRQVARCSRGGRSEPARPGRWPRPPSSRSRREEQPVKVTVTGATGTLGRELVRALQDRGDEVTVLSRDADRARSVRPRGQGRRVARAQAGAGSRRGARGPGRRGPPHRRARRPALER